MTATRATVRHIIPKGATMYRRLALIAVTILAAALPAAAAAAATLDDVRALGYTVAKASDCQTPEGKWLTTWYVSGFGVGTYLSECDPEHQAAVDSIANPQVHFERRWQHEHPEQLAAAQELAAKCYSIGRAAPATDSWRITALLVDLTVKGAELPALAATLPSKRAGDGSCNATVAIVPSTGSGGAVTVPGQVEIRPVLSPEVQTAVDVAAARFDTVTVLVESLADGATEAEALRITNVLVDAGEV